MDWWHSPIGQGSFKIFIWKSVISITRRKNYPAPNFKFWDLNEVIKTWISSISLFWPKLWTIVFHRHEHFFCTFFTLLFSIHVKHQVPYFSNFRITTFPPPNKINPLFQNNLPAFIKDKLSFFQQKEETGLPFSKISSFFHRRAIAFRFCCATSFQN